MTFVGMRDDEFTFDNTVYEETRKKNEDFNKNASAWLFDQEVKSKEPNVYA